MRRVRLILILQIFCLLAAVVANAQVKNNVTRIHAYLRETVQGNIQVDEKGNPLNNGVDHIHYLYAETTGKFLPQWNRVYTHFGVFAIQAEEVDSLKVTVGKLKNSSTISVITCKRGNRLWKLNLVSVKTRTPANITALLKKNDAVVLTQFGNKQFIHTISKEMELEPFFYE